jgi:hypothetical protein
MPTSYGPNTLELAAAPFSPAPVQELLRLFVKAARAHQLYLPNNPIHRSAIEALRAGFTPIWAETDELDLAITETELQWFGLTVLTGDKSTDNIAWLFFKDGVRGLRLMKGIQDTEIVKLLELVQRARRASPDDDDIVAMLWEADFMYLSYRHVDLLAEVDADFPNASGGSDVAPAEIRASTEEAVEEAQARGIVRIEDFDSTLYFLDENETDYVHRELKREYEVDLRANVVAALLDVFETQIDADTRGEVIDDVYELMVHLLAAGHFQGVANVLREVRIALQRTPGVSDEHRNRLEQLSEQLSAPESLGQLIQALDDTPILPPEGELAELFDQLRPSALAPVFLWLSRIRNESLRPLLAAAANRLAAANTAELVSLILAPEREISDEAIRRAGALRAQGAVSVLGKVMGDQDPERRLSATQALSEIASPGAFQVLERAVSDTSREVRITAVRTLATHAYRPMLPRLDAAIKAPSLRDADLTEKMAFFEAYGTLCGDGGVVYLDSILNGRSLFGRRDDTEIRACAAISLGRIGTEGAFEALRRAASEKDVVVRNAVSRALRGGSQ